MLLVRICCRGRARCVRADVKTALEHAAQRSRYTGRGQNIRYADGAWQITEAPRRPREESDHD